MREKVRLKDIAIHSKGKQINGIDLVANGRYNYLNGGINPSGKWNEFNNEGNTITISEGGNSSGYVNYMVEPFWCGAHCYYLYGVKGNSKYLYYALKSKQEEIMRLRTGTAMPNIKKSTLGEFSFTYDNNVVEQAKVVQILEKTEKIIENLRAQLIELDNLIKSRFVEMFGDIKNNLYKCQVRTVGDFTDVLTGATPKRDNPDFFGGTIPWVKTGEISKGRITDAEEFITEKAVKETNCKLLPIGTIIVAMYGQGKTRGQTGILNIEATTNQACAAIIPNTSYNSLFMYRQLELRYDDLREMGRGGNQPNLNLSMVRNFRVLFPNIEIQNEFADFATQVDKMKFAIQKSLDETQMLFDALMREYFG